MLCVSSFCANIASAQLPDGTIVPNFTGTDINGNTWNLYQLLDSGKTVFIDVSATWCGPCWSYHNSGKLETLYNTYGPSGTNELMVLFVEGDDQTTLSDLYGTGSNTQGNWVAGTPYPIIDDGNIANILDISYFPTLYMVCPDRVIKEVGQLTAAQHYAQKTANCFSATQATDAGITNSMVALNGNAAFNGTLESCNAVDINYRLCNYGTAPLTSATIDLDLNGTIASTLNWTGNLNTYESVQLTFSGVSTPYGDNPAVVVVSNPNGQADPTSANNSRSARVIHYRDQGQNPGIQETYATTTFPPANWVLINGGNSPGWTRSTAGNGGVGCAKMDFYSSPSGDRDVLQLPEIDTRAITNPVLTFDVSHARYSTSYTDNLKVRVSSNCGLSWVNVYNKSGANLATTANTTSAYIPTSAAQWRTETVNLSTYVGRASLLVRFEGTSGSGNNCYVDNVSISYSSTGIGSIEANQIAFDVYPNPATTRASVDFTLSNSEEVTLEVYNKIGSLVYTRAEGNLLPGEYTFEIPTSDLAKGIYMVNIKTAQGSSMKKLVVE